MASIHENRSDPKEGGARDWVEVSSDGVSLRNATLSFCIQWAYDVKFYQVAGPGWLKDQRWDIQAGASGPSSVKDLRLMMQSLLRERFKLVAHTESQSRPVYLLLSKGTSRLERTSAPEPSIMGIIGESFIFRGTTMSEFALRLSDFATVDRPVLDRTGIEGACSFTLEGAAKAVRGGDGPAISTAISEIGLQLKPANEPIEIILVDAADKTPSAN